MVMACEVCKLPAIYITSDLNVRQSVAITLSPDEDRAMSDKSSDSVPTESSVLFIDKQMSSALARE